MGEMTTFPCAGGNTADGYLTIPASGSGPAVLVVQEWWGLAPQIKRVADRLAEAGFVALAPDLYHGELAEHTEMDKAGKLMSELPMDRAARDMGGAIDHLLANPCTQSTSVGVIGFCMGGMLTMVIAALEGDKIGAAVPFYGAPLGDSAPDWSKMTAPVRGHFAENDDFFPPTAIKELERQLKEMGKDVQLDVHPGTGHAFANEDDPLGTYNP
ncbi:MAG TPA: dienelactone hydrolase family protein, partial [Acidimicrobiia bacterium]|nr:dienelactone hydrolase family protein [Acidimicrobiia bacterium]